MARFEFLRTTATEALGVAGRSTPVPLVPSMAAIARTARYLDTDATALQPAERVIAILWDALTRAGARPTIHQAAMLVDASRIPADMRPRVGGDFVVHSEPGDPTGKPAPTEDAEEAGGSDDNLPTGPAADDPEPDPLPGRRLLPES